MNLIGPFSSGATTGGAGVSAGNANSKNMVRGRVLGVYVKYTGAAAGTVTTIKTAGTAPNAPSLTLLTLTSVNASGWYFPRVQVHGVNGAALAATYDMIPVYDYLNVAVASSNDGSTVEVYLLIWED